MAIEYKKLLESLGVKHTLSAYETQPWLHYDDDKGITCSAEVRIGPGMENLETEIQFMYDEPPEDIKHNPDQIMLMRVLPKGDFWHAHSLLVMGEDYRNKFGGWDTKAYNFFRACIQELQMGKLPDIDELLKKELSEDESSGAGRGKIGRKSPKANTSAMLGIKKPM